VSFDIVNLDGEGGIVRVEPVSPGGKRSNDIRVFEMPISGSRRVVVTVGQFYGVNKGNIQSVRFTLQEGVKRRFGVTRIVLSEKGDSRPQSDPPPMPRETAAHGAAMAAFLAKCADAGSVAGEMAVGIAPAGVAVKPRGDFRAEAATNVCISLARNEYEAFQVVVAPRGARPLTGVKIDVAGDMGMFEASNITASVMGYVHVKEPASYKARGVDGKVRWPERTWYPDPILAFKTCTDVAAGDVQSFWVRVKCPAGQRPGTYRGELRVSDANGASLSIPIMVRVRDFTLPLVPPTDMAICFNPRYFEVGASALRQNKEAPINIWKRHRIEWCDFLSEYFITMDDIYLKEMPDWEMLERLKSRGRLGRFNLGYWNGFRPGVKAKADWMGKGCGARLKAAADEAKRRGLIEYAYFYGCDESPKKWWPNQARGASAMKAMFPGIPFLTTIRDDSCGTDSILGDIDSFVPNIAFWNITKVAQGRRAGHKVWWYICSDPKAPGPNVFVECPPVEVRLLMGAMTQRFKPDGFLYYALALWRSQKPITDGPFTDWLARNREFYHGDGCLTYCGPDGTPIASQHLENFRDGLEDLWYAKLLEQKLRAVESGKLKFKSRGDAGSNTSLAIWTERARKLLSVPTEVVRSVTNFSTEPDVVHRWRNEMADLIEEEK
jgi:hypothetical protein